MGKLFNKGVGVDVEMVRRGGSDWHVHGPSLGRCGVYHKYKGSDSTLL